MLRRRLVGIAVGFLAAFIASPAQAAEWCLHDPALTFAPPHAHRVTIYATEGVEGTAHLAALHKMHLDFDAKPGKHHGTMHLRIRLKIPDVDHHRFATLLVVSSEPFGAGTVYGVDTGTSGQTMEVEFDYVYATKIPRAPGK
jgi:hypothetical protein